MAEWKLTVRRGSQVRRSDFDHLDDAMAELRAQAEEVRQEGPLRPRSMLRDFTPAEQVAARIEISGRGLIRRPTAGVDVKGDGAIVPFIGGVRREELEAQGGSAYDAVRNALSR